MKTMKGMTKSLNFTLIELMIVIAIISVLISMMLPALSVSRDIARRLTCAGNLKQCIMGSISYSGDFNGHMPDYYQYPYLNVSPDPPPNNVEVRWFGFIYALGYVGSMKIGVCPTQIQNSIAAEANGGDMMKIIGLLQVHSYGQRTSLGNWINLSRIQNSSTTIIYADSCYFSTWLGINKWVHASTITMETVPAATTDRTVQLRHINTANAAFLDGHAISASRSEFRRFGITGGRTSDFSAISF